MLVLKYAKWPIIISSGGITVVISKCQPPSITRLLMLHSFYFFSCSFLSLFFRNGIRGYYTNGSPTPEWPTCQPSKFTERAKGRRLLESVAQRALDSALQRRCILISAESRDDPTTTSDPQRVKAVKPSS